MSQDHLAVQLEGVSKKLCRSLRYSMAYGIKDILMNTFGLGAVSGLRREEFWAIDDLTVDIKKGEIVGVIGPNGAGKTTFLRLLGGIFEPDKGQIIINGKVGSLIEIGAGFHPLFSGRDNMYISGAILGMSKKEISGQLEKIVDFADIGDFIDVPIKFYSSGMLVRLGFSIVAHCQPEVLLVDEVLAVGDIEFQSKCLNKIGELNKQGTTIIFVSHSLPTVQRICKRCLFINAGRLVSDSHTKEASAIYYKWLCNSGAAQSQKQDIVSDNNEVGLRHIAIYDAKGNKKRCFETGEKITLVFGFNTVKKIYRPTIHLSFLGDTYHNYNTREDNLIIETVDNHTDITLEIDFLGLSCGVYNISLGLWDTGFLSPYFWSLSVAEIEISSAHMQLGRFVFKHSWQIS